MNIITDLTKALPHDELAERALLGAMLIDNKYVNEVFSLIKWDDFYRESHQKIAAAINKLIDQGKAADTVTVAEYLEKEKEIKFVGGYDYLNSLLDGIPANINMDEYIQIVKDRSALRKLIIILLGVVQSGVEPRADTRDILSRLQEDIIKIAEMEIRTGFHSADKIVPETMSLIDNIQKHGDSGGLKTEFYALDDLTGGFQKSDFIVIAARPAMGKTALGLNMATNMAVKHGKSVGFFSIEMSRHQIVMRLLASEAGVSMSALRTGKPHLNSREKSDLNMAAGNLSKARLFIDDSASLSIIEMKTRCRRLIKEKGLDIVFVDYLQLIKVTGESLRRSDSRAQEVAIISASLKELAKEMQIPVVAMAQLNRSPEQRGSKREGPRYQLSDLKESGAIEQDADVVIFLHREEQVDRETERKGEADLILAKQRNGPTGKITLAYQDKFTKFGNLEYREYGEEE